MDQSEVPLALFRHVKDTSTNYLYGILFGTILFWMIPGWIHGILVFVGILTLTSCVTARCVHEWKPRQKLSSKGKAVIISGCDSGFGRDLALKLDNMGYTVFAGCLYPDEVEAQQLKMSFTGKSHLVHLDVTDEQNVQQALEYVNTNLGESDLWAVVCNAEVKCKGELFWTSQEAIEAVFNVNTFGAVRVIRAFLSQLCLSKGRIVVTVSACGHVTFPYIVPYCMSKHATRSFCEGLRMEMYKWGVKVIDIEPWTLKLSSPEKDMTQAWDKVPIEIKRLYPDDYSTVARIHHFITTLTRCIGYCATDTVSSMVEAVTAQDPKYSYTPGRLHLKVCLMLSTILSKPIFDFVMFYGILKFSKKIKLYLSQ